MAYTRLPSFFAKRKIQHHRRSGWTYLGPQQFIVWPLLAAYSNQTLVNWELVLSKRSTSARLTNVYHLLSQAHTLVSLKTLHPISGFFYPLDATEAVYPAENAGAVYQTLDMMPLFWQVANTANDHLLTTYARCGVCSSCIYSAPLDSTSPFVPVKSPHMHHELTF